eukprot:gene10839-10919_t
MLLWIDKSLISAHVGNGGVNSVVARPHIGNLFVKMLGNRTMLTTVVTAFRAMIACEAGLTSTEYSTMGGSMAGGISDAGSSLVDASSSAIDAVGRIFGWRLAPRLNACSLNRSFEMKKSTYVIAAIAAAGLLGAVGDAHAVAAKRSFKSVVSSNISAATKQVKTALASVTTTASDGTTSPASVVAKAKLTADTAASKLLAKDAKALTVLKKTAGPSKQVNAAYAYALTTNGVAGLPGNTVTVTAGGTTPTTYNFVIPTTDVATVQGGTSFTALNKLKAYWTQTLKADKLAYANATKPNDAAVSAAFASLLKGSSANCLGTGATTYSAAVAPATSAIEGGLWVRITTAFNRMLGCEAGLASVEYTVVAASLGVTLVVGAFHLAPKIHAYLLYVEHRSRIAAAFIALWRDEDGLAAIEFCILMGSLGAASVAAGVALGPVLHPYLLRVVASFEAAQTTLRGRFMALGFIAVFVLVAGFLMGMESSSPGVIATMIRAGVLVSYSVKHDMPLEICQAQQVALKTAVAVVAVLDASLLTAAGPADEILLATRLDAQAPQHAAALILFGPMGGFGWLSSVRAVMAGAGVVTLFALITAGRLLSGSLVGAVLIAVTAMMSPPLVQAFASGRLIGPALACAALAGAFGWRSPNAVAALVSGLASAAAGAIDPAFWPAAAAVPAACLVGGQLRGAVLAALAPVAAVSAGATGAHDLISLIALPDFAVLGKTLFGFGGLGLLITILGTALLRLGRGGGSVGPDAGGALFLVGSGVALGVPALGVLGLVWIAAALAGLLVGGQSPMPVLVVQAGGVITGLPLLAGLLIMTPTLLNPVDWTGAVATRQAARLEGLLHQQDRLVATVTPSQVIDSAPVIPSLVSVSGAPVQIAREVNEILSKTPPAAVVAGEVPKALRQNNDILRAWAVSHGYRPQPAGGPLQAVLVLAVTVAAGALPHRAQAMQATFADTEEGCILSLTGAVNANDPARFERIAGERPQCRIVSLDIRAGLLGPALTIGRAIRARGMTTIVLPDFACVGVCVWMLAGGETRIVVPKAAVGIQYSSFASNDQVQRQVREQIKRNGEGGAASTIRAVERAVAQMMAGLVIYVAEMGITPSALDAFAQSSPDAPRWLSQRELTEWRLVSPAK